MFRDTPNQPQDLQPQGDFYSQFTSTSERLKKEPSRAQKKPPSRALSFSNILTLSPTPPRESRLLTCTILEKLR